MCIFILKMIVLSKSGNYINATLYILWEKVNGCINNVCFMIANDDFIFIKKELISLPDNVLEFYCLLIVF